MSRGPVDDEVFLFFQDIVRPWLKYTARNMHHDDHSTYHERVRRLGRRLGVYCHRVTGNKLKRLD